MQQQEWGVMDRCMHPSLVYLHKSGFITIRLRRTGLETTATSVRYFSGVRGSEYIIVNAVDNAAA